MRIDKGHKTWIDCFAPHEKWGLAMTGLRVMSLRGACFALCQARQSNLRAGNLVRATFFALLSIFCFNSLNAQDISATFKADSTHILIGDYLKVKLTVKYLNEEKISMPVLTDTIGNMEVVKESKTDTGVSGSFKTLTKTFTVSAYDSGQYHIGPEMIKFRNKDGAVDSVLSNYVLVSVNTVPVDTTKDFKPIKMPAEVPYTLKEFLPYIIGGGILLVIIIVAIYLIWRMLRKKKPAPVEKPRPKGPPHIWAKEELKKLEEEKLWQKDEIKSYYSRLTTILRLYLEYRYNWLALESTTEEIMENIGSYNISSDAQDNLVQILKQADLVKFAKMMPMPDTNMKVMENAYRFINLTEQKEEKTEVKNDV